ncbi:hypothetical protein QJS10_CPB04g00671 [Acorus calamus]|uniref:Uncharacterized protein n=1 Tax=Acorus calamus TaxID=4465 RepID=A0AAV9EXC6_ACOCL|nr:hypothetical protein QJS10_CPB04g00671 [Acorus calamus]
MWQGLGSILPLFVDKGMMHLMVLMQMEGASSSGYRIDVKSVFVVLLALCLTSLL